MKNWQVGIAAISSPEIAWSDTFVKAETEAGALQLAINSGFTRNVRVREVEARP